MIRVDIETHHLSTCHVESMTEIEHLRTKYADYEQNSYEEGYGIGETEGFDLNKSTQGKAYENVD